jgi:hypothetical protein
MFVARALETGSTPFVAAVGSVVVVSVAVVEVVAVFVASWMQYVVVAWPSA